jgi:hypothetical protein
LTVLSPFCKTNQEHIWSILFDHSKYKDMDGIYFEIWKRVAKLKVSMSVSTTKYGVFLFRFFVVIGCSLILVLHILNSPTTSFYLCFVFLD